ncbi:hypothetical protein FVE85_7010 [Porphyridium purpureum]|uniref:Uncharacterized protein n=1 Tax=Porphyridium purpureum TaxID=35688 RepID=A0A5J4Z7X4_PORPP|nr:hypothetical protein FVE85_7010 [Porphyridium purpureum]|eukprot:POR4572..scf295_1
MYSSSTELVDALLGMADGAGHLSADSRAAVAQRAREFLVENVQSSTQLRDLVPELAETLRAARRELEVERARVDQRAADAQDTARRAQLDAQHVSACVAEKGRGLVGQYEACRSHLDAQKQARDAIRTAQEQYRLALQSAFVFELRRAGWPIRAQPQKPQEDHALTRRSARARGAQGSALVDLARELYSLQQQVEGPNSDARSTVGQSKPKPEDAWPVRLALRLASRRARLQIESGANLDPCSVPQLFMRVIRSITYELRALARGELQRVLEACSSAQPNSTYSASVNFSEILVQEMLRQFVRGVVRTVARSAGTPKSGENPGYGRAAQNQLKMVCNVQVPLAEAIVYAAFQAAEELDTSRGLASTVHSAVNALASEKVLLNYYSVCLCRIAEAEAQERLETMFEPVSYFHSTLLLIAKNGVRAGGGGEEQAGDLMRCELAHKEETMFGTIARVPTTVWRIMSPESQVDVVNQVELAIVQAVCDELSTVGKDVAGALAMDSYRGRKQHAQARQALPSDFAPEELDPSIYARKQDLLNSSAPPSAGTKPASKGAVGASLFVKALRCCSISYTLAQALRERGEEEPYVRLYAHVFAKESHDQSLSSQDQLELLSGTIFDSEIWQLESISELILDALVEHMGGVLLAHASQYIWRCRSGESVSSSGGQYSDTLLAQLRANALVVLDTSVALGVRYVGQALKVARLHLGSAVLVGRLWRRFAVRLDEQLLSALILPALSGSHTEDGVPTSAVDMSAESEFVVPEAAGRHLWEACVQAAEVGRLVLREFTSEPERYFRLVTGARALVASCVFKDDAEGVAHALAAVQKSAPGFMLMRNTPPGGAADAGQVPAVAAEAFDKLREQLELSKLDREEIRHLVCTALGSAAKLAS